MKWQFLKKLTLIEDINPKRIGNKWHELEISLSYGLERTSSAKKVS